MDRCLDNDEIFLRLFFEGLDGDGAGVRDFLVGLLDHLFPDDFGDKKTLCLVGDHLIGIEGRHFRKVLEKGPDQQVRSLACQGGDRDDFLEAAQVLIPVNQGKEGLFLQPVDLIDDQEGDSAAPLHRSDHLPVLFQRRHQSVDEKEENVGIFSRGDCGRDHPLVQRRPPRVDAGSVEKDQLTPFHVLNPEDPIPCRLGLR